MGHTRLFLQHSLANYKTVGAVHPTSARAARAMAAELIRRDGAPTRVLEIGPGVGPITAQIVKAMGPEDTLTCVELMPEYAEVLRRRFADEPDFRRVAGRSEVITGDVRELAEDAEFDVVIASVPFNTLGEETTRGIFEVIRRVLRPGGTCTYIEYAWLRGFRQAFDRFTGRGGGHSDFLDDLLDRHRFRTDLVFGNIPPAWAHHLRFTDAPDAEAEEVGPARVPTSVPLTRRMHIDRDGVGIAAGAAVATGLVGLAGRGTQSRLARGAWLLPAGLGLAGAAFFRDPVREVPADPEAIVSSVDGKVLSVERLDSDEHLGPGPWLRIATFLSIFSVHINRSPVAGRVVEVIDRNEGGYAAAMKPAAEHNVAKTVVLQTTRGRVGVTQRTGMVARRIVVRHGAGSVLAKGERYGLIRFGSRTDVYLPADRAEAVVSKGTVVRGGKSVIARWC